MRACPSALRPLAFARLGARSRGATCKDDFALRVVVDTNVIVSALLKAESVSERALDAILSDTTVLFDERVLAEYTSVLERPKFKDIARARIATLLGRIRECGTAIAHDGTWVGESRDVDDRIFIALALAGRADAVVTGNIRDFPIDLGFAVLAPAMLLAQIEDTRSSAG